MNGDRRKRWSGTRSGRARTKRSSRAQRRVRAAVPSSAAARRRWLGWRGARGNRGRSMEAAARRGEERKSGCGGEAGGCRCCLCGRRRGFRFCSRSCMVWYPLPQKKIFGALLCCLAGSSPLKSPTNYCWHGRCRQLAARLHQNSGRRAVCCRPLRRPVSGHAQRKERCKQGNQKRNWLRRVQRDWRRACPGHHTSHDMPAVVDVRTLTSRQ